MFEYERVYAEIDLNAIKENVLAMKKHIAAGTKILAVIKTDGYGHGAIPIANELEKEDSVYGFAVATAEEALDLRKNNIQKPILILGYTFPGKYEELIKNHISMALFREDSLLEIAKVAEQIGQKALVHIKVDTGMGRIGIRPNDEGVAFAGEILHSPYLCLEGVFTHFAKADEENKEFTYGQLNKFNEFVSKIEKTYAYNIPIKHASNSAGIIDISKANLDLVRAGIILYGLWPSDEVSKEKISLKPALSLYSTIVYIKEVEKGTPISYGGKFVADRKMKIATIPVGYGDGYPRSLSNKGYVLINGKKAPILGRVCMDQFMADVTHIEDVKMGDRVTLIGEDKEERITVEELGEIADKFNYEFVCGLSKRIPRIFVKDKKVIGTENYFEGVFIS